MEKATKKERIALMASELSLNPGKTYSLKEFAQMFDCAKSSISEDLKAVSQAFAKSGRGKLLLRVGKNGGATYLPFLDNVQEKEFLDRTAQILCDPGRILPGGYIYTIDVLLNTETLNPIGAALASRFFEQKIDYIVTAETKGISVALAVANVLKKPVVIARRDTKITEGSIVTINYLSGTTRRLQTISIAKRAIKPRSNAIIIDDFIAGGGTVRAISDMMSEFDVTVTGIGCVIATKYPEKKKIRNFTTLFTLYEVNEEEQTIILKPNIPVKN